ncbi:TPA: NAD(P)-dependent oxidoreductase [Candidatus Poribacteria bacterium]|nr:NAD(P)-dependent oxidoreductase [Candidatus Poribacteria bacterium]
MKVLLVGGSGHVGTMTLPYMKPNHQFRILDLTPPRDPSVDYTEGSVTDPDIVQQALKGMDTFVYMVMRRPTSDNSSVANFDDIIANHEVNVMGLHILLHAAKAEGIQHGVYTSTFTVHERTRNHFPAEEKVPLDNPGVYGLSKGFGEQICQYFCREHKMSIIALRITGPSTRQQWLERRAQPKSNPVHIWWTDEEDLAMAYLSAISVLHTGFNAVFIAGDAEQKEINLSKAKQLLGWEPLTHISSPTE